MNIKKKLKKSSDGLETKKVDNFLKADKDKFIENGCYNLVDNKFITKKNRSKINMFDKLCAVKPKCTKNKEIKEKIDYECEVTENFNLSPIIFIILF